MKIIKSDPHQLHGYKFTEQEFRIIKANESDTLQKCNPTTSEESICNAILKAQLVLGHGKKPTEECLFMANEVFHFLKRKHPLMRIQEVCLAIELGSFGEYDKDIVYVSVKNIVGWCKTYLNRKHSVFSTLTTAKEKQALKTAENERNQKILDYWQNFPEEVEAEYNNFKDSNQLTIAADRIIKGLDKIGFGVHLDIDKKEKFLMFEAEEKRVKAKELQELQKKHFAVNEKMLQPKSIKDQTITECKKRCLENYFNQLEAFPEEIKELTNQFIEQL